MINGASFLAVLLSLVMLRPARPPISEMDGAARARGTLVGGLRYVLARPDLKAILLMLFLVGAFGLNFPIFISAMAVGVFHADAGQYGLLSSALAAGTFLGALGGAWRAQVRFGHVLGGAGLFALGCALAAIAPNPWLFAGCLVVTGAAALTFTNATTSLMQLSTAPAMGGRVMALRLAVGLGGTPIGAPLVGWVANRFGPRWALGVAAAAGLITTLVACIHTSFAEAPEKARDRKE